LTRDFAGRYRPTVPQPRPTTVAAFAIPLAALFAGSALSQPWTGPCIDEHFYPAAAKQLWRSGRFDALNDAGTAPLPILLAYPVAVAVRSEAIPDVPWTATDGDRAPLDIARWTQVVAVGVPLIVVVAGWVYHRTGSALTAGASGTFAATSPSLLAHVNVATTDACFTLFFLLALVAVGWHAAAPSRGRFAVAGLFAGLAVASKYSGVFVLPVAYVVGVLADRAVPMSEGRRFLRAATTHPARVLGLAAVAFVVCWAACGFQFHATPLESRGPALTETYGKTRVGRSLVRKLVSVRLPAPVAGFANQLAASSSKVDASLYPSRLFGRESGTGHKKYYAVALLAKSTPAELVVLAFAACGAVGTGVRAVRGRPSDHAALAFALGVAVLFIVCSLGSKQFGSRYVLPAFVVAPLLGVPAVGAYVTSARLRRLVLVSLLAAQAVSVSSAVYRPLSYFNDAFGGPDNGIRVLGNADVDWGQATPDLAAYLGARGESAVVNLLSGPTRLEPLGIRSLPPAAEPPCRYVAVGTTRLFRGAATEPVLLPFADAPNRDLVGHSIFVYDTADPNVLAAYRRAIASLR
jgi:4-amino-4-deoxy-L-arabinose transferase-like glycosyltransferase